MEDDVAWLPEWKPHGTLQLLPPLPGTAAQSRIGEEATVSLLEDEVTQRGLKCPLCVSIFHQLPFLPMLESHDWAQVKWAGAPPSQTKESWEKATSVFQATTSGEKVLYLNRPLMWSKLLGQDEKGWPTEMDANRVLAAQFWKRPASGRRVPSLQMNALHC